MFSVFLGVGYYGNREAEKGLDSTLDAVASATETVGRVLQLVSRHCRSIDSILPFELETFVLLLAEAAKLQLRYTDQLSLYLI